MSSPAICLIPTERLLSWLCVAVACSEELKAQSQVTARHEDEINKLRILLEDSANLAQVYCLLTNIVLFLTFANTVIVLGIINSAVLFSHTLRFLST